MGLYSFFRISKPSEEQVAAEKIDSTYKSLRNKTFWGATVAYSLYYVCRMSLSVVKQPLIDEGVLSAGELGVIGSALLFVYAVGKFLNGFIADYCNIKRFMATGLFFSALRGGSRHPLSCASHAGPCAPHLHHSRRPCTRLYAQRARAG